MLEHGQILQRKGQRFVPWGYSLAKEIPWNFSVDILTKNGDHLQGKVVDIKRTTKQRNNNAVIVHLTTGRKASFGGGTAMSFHAI